MDVFLDEKIVVEIGGAKIHSSIRQDLYRQWGRLSVRHIFNKTGKVPLAAFDLIHWDSVGRAMSTFPDTYFMIGSQDMSPTSTAVTITSLGGGKASKAYATLVTSQRRHQTYHEMPTPCPTGRRS